MAYIYLITNIINDKKYVGFTTQKLSSRMKQHQQKCSKCPSIRNAIQKYGWNSFRYDVLAESEDVEYLLNVVENEMIQKHKPEYNLSSGGRGGKIGNHSPHPKNRVSVSQYTHTGEFIRDWYSAKEAAKELHLDNTSITHVCRQDNGALCVGGYQWRYKSDNITFLPPTRLFKQKRIVERIVDGQVFESLNEAAIDAGVAKSTMVKLCQTQNRYRYTQQ